MVINDYEKAKSLFADTEIKVFRKGKNSHKSVHAFGVYQGFCKKYYSLGLCKH